MSTLSVHRVALESITALRPLLTRIQRMDRDLHDQIRRAANSMSLNIGEALGSLGGNTRARFHTALGSAREVRSGLQLAVVVESPSPLTTRARAESAMLGLSTDLVASPDF